jgi:hypothetical protein
LGGVRAGIDTEACARLARGLSDPGFEIRDEHVARGQPARQGESGRFESPYLLGAAPGHVREDGTMDFHDRELLKPIEEGTVLGQLVPAQPGSAGFLVDGTAIAPSPVKDAVLQLGPGALREPSGVVRAARSGVVLCKPPLGIDVVDHYVHEGPVNLKSGDLNMLGSLLVKGDVENTFSVYATGDVEIRGSIDNGSVYAGGNLRIHYGVRGEGALVCAVGGLSVHHAESATLHAGLSLEIAESLHSKLTAKQVEASGKLRGGVTHAEFSIVVQEAGSVQGVATELAVGEPLELPTETAQRHLERAKAGRGVRQRSNGPRPAQDRVKGGKQGRTRAELQEEETQRLAARSQRAQELASVAFIQARVVHPGVSLRIGHETLHIDAETRDSRFCLDRETQKLGAQRIKS